MFNLKKVAYDLNNTPEEDFIKSNHYFYEFVQRYLEIPL
jgi:hypothetical protein